MTWHVSIEDADDNTPNGVMRIRDHTAGPGDAPTIEVPHPDPPEVTVDQQGVPVTPDFRDAVLDHVESRGQADIYALVAVAEALSGAGVVRGSP